MHGIVETRGRSPSLGEAESARLRGGFFCLILFAVLAWIMISAYARSGTLVALRVNGDEWQSRTHQQTVGAFLREAGLELRPEDIVFPTADTLLTESTTIVVQKALPMLVSADGQVTEHYTHSRQVLDVLRETGLSLSPYDVVTLDGRAVELTAPLVHYRWQPSRWPLLPGPLRRLRQEPTSPWTRITLQRAIALSINDEGTQTSMHTVARTVGEALLSQGITLYLGDLVRPLLGTLLTTGMHVEIHRARPVTVQVDGQVVETRTQARSVAQLLNEAGIQLAGRDYTVPNLDAPVQSDMALRVVRVVEDWVLEAQDIAYETVWRSDADLELDQMRTDQRGRAGVRKRRIHIVYEDGQETTRTVDDEWVERQPTTGLVSYGTKIVVRELETSDGVIRYWRKIRMLATSYTAATSGKRPDHPEYGITRLGWKARKGIVAVDPRVIRLRTPVYVPGYGFGIAADTGGMILGRWIDLCYDEDNLVLWKKWVDVYLLEPVPPTTEVPWILPDYPTERR